MGPLCQLQRCFHLQWANYSNIYETLFTLGPESSPFLNLSETSLKKYCKLSLIPVPVISDFIPWSEWFPLAWLASQGGSARPTRAHSSGLGSGGHHSHEQAPCLLHTDKNILVSSSLYEGSSAKHSMCRLKQKGLYIEEGWREKQRQRSSRLFGGGQYVLNSSLR